MKASTKDINENNKVHEHRTKFYAIYQGRMPCFPCKRRSHHCTTNHFSTTKGCHKPLVLLTLNEFGAAGSRLPGIYQKRTNKKVTLVSWTGDPTIKACSRRLRLSMLRSDSLASGAGALHRFLLAYYYYLYYCLLLISTTVYCYLLLSSLLV